MATGYTESDLLAMGLVKQPDGSYKKPKTVQQPREVKFPTLTNMVQNLTQPIGEKRLTEKEKAEGISIKREIKLFFDKPKKIKKVKESEPTYWKGMNIQDVFANATENGYIFIPHNVPSSKNGRGAFNGKAIQSHLCVKYKKNTEIHWKVFKSRFLKMIEGKEKPYKIEMFFVRDSKRRFDHHNLVQLPFDQMTKFGWIDDDNSDEVLSFPPYPKAYAIDKNIPGIIISVI